MSHEQAPPIIDPEHETASATVYPQGQEPITYNLKDPAQKAAYDAFIEQDQPSHEVPAGFVRARPFENEGDQEDK